MGYMEGKMSDQLDGSISEYAQMCQEIAELRAKVEELESHQVHVSQPIYQIGEQVGSLGDDLEWTDVSEDMFVETKRRALIFAEKQKGNLHNCRPIPKFRTVFMHATVEETQPKEGE